MESFTIEAPGGREAPGLVLSAPTTADIERIFQLCQDPEIQEWTSVPRGYTRDDARVFAEEIVPRGWAQGKELTWALRPVAQQLPAGSDGEPDGVPALVGVVGLSLAGDGTAEIGYWLGAPYRGRGLMARAVRAVIEAAFDPEGPVAQAGRGPLSALRWRCDIHDGVPNWASWRLAWSVGFRKEGQVRRLLRNDGVLHDGWIATLLPTDPRRPQAPWDGPTAQGPAQARGARTPLVATTEVGRREGDDPEALVRRFHHTYGLPIQTDGPSLERRSLEMRMSLIAEEFAELTGAVYGPAARAEIEAAYTRAVAGDEGTRDVVESADALADLIYVIYGMALETGIDLAAVLAEVQRSNMSKLGADGRPIYREDGKVLKGPGYFPPDVAGALRAGRG
ncbi:bifunctional GNAT family N-acetyltransferase/nucleoside triphosphate pyrophosphohydrolase family protein [Actinomyces capricornis]|uniref:N-acetyltransferase domain-containing protein n=1 Tax=Actinomyces capricornis TaxID=2755559 RepID=A0ABM7UE47_9ACTO|nr:bifunctional GNAT family N-acetyltransferase/nucleoside triphosphate pyrophosphohydrolase family protein [Actinomyces capricornis]BDA65432.1 hypothetical protein MANAM107_22660 [Actinomyces capricornis]